MVCLVSDLATFQKLPNLYAHFGEEPNFIFHVFRYVVTCDLIKEERKN